MQGLTWPATRRRPRPRGNWRRGSLEHYEADYAAAARHGAQITNFHMAFAAVIF
jgi:hypothetical protein